MYLHRSHSLTKFHTRFSEGYSPKNCTPFDFPPLTNGFDVNRPRFPTNFSTAALAPCSQKSLPSYPLLPTNKNTHTRPYTRLRFNQPNFSTAALAPCSQKSLPSYPLLPTNKNTHTRPYHRFRFSQPNLSTAALAPCSQKSLSSYPLPPTNKNAPS